MWSRAVLALSILTVLAAPCAYAADHAAVNETIWPSQNDIAQTAGNGKKLLENQWAKPATALAPNNYTISGFTVPGTSASLNIDVALGTALIAGRHITIPAATSVTAAASNTNHVFLKLTRDGSSLGTGVSFEVNITGTPPTDSIKIATMTAGASTITATSDARILPTTITVLTSGTTFTMPAGITNIYVEVLGAGGGGGGGGEAASTNNGGAGTAGGTTSFDTLSATGGAAGGSGLGSSATTAAITGAAHGVGSGGQVNMNGKGSLGGNGGRGGGTPLGGTGGHGGDGGYAASRLVAPQGSDLTYAIGAAGAAGAGGTGAGGNDGAAGRAGIAGLIVIHY